MLETSGPYYKEHVTPRSLLLFRTASNLNFHCILSTSQKYPPGEPICGIKGNEWIFVGFSFPNHVEDIASELDAPYWRTCT